MQRAQISPSLKSERDFVGMVIDTLALERPVYRELHAFMMAHDWPAWG